jgi:hypothetical protein
LLMLKFGLLNALIDALKSWEAEVKDLGDHVYLLNETPTGKLDLAEPQKYTISFGPFEVRMQVRPLSRQT